MLDVPKKKRKIFLMLSFRQIGNNAAKRRVNFNLRGNKILQNLKTRPFKAAAGFHNRDGGVIAAGFYREDPHVLPSGFEPEFQP